MKRGLIVTLGFSIGINSAYADMHSFYGPDQTSIYLPKEEKQNKKISNDQDSDTFYTSGVQGRAYDTGSAPTERRSGDFYPTDRRRDSAREARTGYGEEPGSRSDNKAERRETPVTQRNYQTAETNVTTEPANSGEAQYSYSYEARNESRRWEGQDKSMTFGDFMCGLGSGLAGGFIADRIIGSDPITIISGFLASAVGVRYCQNLRDEEKQALKKLTDAASRGAVGQQIPIETSEYRGSVRTLQEGWELNLFGFKTDKICRHFQFSVYRRSSGGANDPFLGISRVWACPNSEGKWIITNKRWIRPASGAISREPAPIVNRDYRYSPEYQYPAAPNTDGYQTGRTDQASGSESRRNSRQVYQSGSDYGREVSTPRQEPRPSPSRNTVPDTDTYTTHGSSLETGSGNAMESYVTLNWKLSDVPRVVDDVGVRRLVQFMNRRTEIGTYKNLEANGTAIRIMVNRAGYEPVERAQNVGVECGVTPFCQTGEVVTQDGVRGVMMYLFQNGDIGIHSSTAGYIIRHISTVRPAY